MTPESLSRFLSVAALMFCLFGECVALPRGRWGVGAVLLAGAEAGLWVLAWGCGP